LKKKRRSLDQIRVQPCHAPSEMVVITWDGNVLRCYEDANREQPLGNIRLRTLGSIWGSADALRGQLARGARCEAGTPCSHCDNMSHVLPDRSVATEPFWKAHPEAAVIAARTLRYAT
jgi:radical SAM protein with 4Fe4S-binding SPASM domain